MDNSRTTMNEEFRELEIDNLDVDGVGSIDAIEINISPEDENPVEVISPKPDGISYAGPVSFDSIDAPRPITETEQKEWYDQQPEVMSLLEGTGAAFQTQWSLMWAVGNDSGIPDANFKPTEELHKELTDGVPEEYWDYFEEAHSEDHARSMRKQMLKSMETERYLNRMGWTGVGLQVAAAILDPVAIGATVASEGMLAPIIYGQKFSRVGRAVATGVAAAGTDMAVEAALVNAKPTGDAEDILWAGMGSFALGTLAGSLHKGVPDEDMEAMASLAARTQKDIDDGVIELRDSAGAMRAHGVDEPISERAYDELMDAKDSPVTAFAGKRYDVVGQVKSSPHPLVRAGGAMGEDAVGNADHSVNVFGATEKQALLFRQFDTEFHREVGSAYRRYSKENGLNWLQRQRKRKAFMEEVTHAIRDDMAEVSEQAVEAAASMRKMYQRYLSEAQQAGVKGFDKVVANPSYVTRLYDHRKIAELSNRFHHTEIQRLLRGAMRSATEGLSEELADKYARWHLRKIRGHAYGVDMKFTRAMAGEDKDALKEIMEEELMKVDGSDFTREDIDELFGLFEKSRDGAHGRAKRRMLFDENFSLPLVTKDRTRAEDVKLTDLFNNDIEELFGMYNRQLSGAIAMAKAGFKTNGEFDTFINNIKKTADQVPGYTERQLEKDIANLEFLRSSVTGMPYNITASGKDARATHWGKVARMVRDYNFLRVMNQVGWAQLSEIGNLMGQTGVKTAMKAVPSFRAFIRDAQTGKLSDELLDECEAIWGIGTDRMRGVVANRWDDFGTPLDLNEGSVLNKVDTALGYGKRITADISGMAPINIALHRWSMKAMVQKFTDMAYDLTPKNRKRLASNGLSEEMVDRISAQIKQHSSVVDGALTKRKIRQINLDGWEPEVADAFKLAVHRMSRRAIQENDAGNVHRWMSSPIMQMFTQFRTFMLVSYSKQLLHGLHMKDMTTVSSFMLSSVAAGMAYTAQTYVKSLGREDAGSYREKYLSPGAIGKASFQRAGWASILPGAYEHTLGMLHEDPVFDYRSTGLSTGLLGNPTFDLVDKAHGTLKAVSGSAMGHQSFSQTDARNFWGLMPFQNAMIIQNFVNAAIADLPRKSK